MSGISSEKSDHLTIDPISNAARINWFPRGKKAFFRAANPFDRIALPSTASFFVISGSSCKTMRLHQIRASGFSITTLAVQSIELKKWASQPIGGSPELDFDKVALDPEGPGATISLLQTYFGSSPTDGILIGRLGCGRQIIKSDTLVDGAEFFSAEWKFPFSPGSRGAVLRGDKECFSLACGAAPASFLTFCIEVEWSEEDE